MSGRLITALLAAGAIAFASSATAQQPMCGPRDQVVSQLKQKYEETAVAAGLINSMILMEVYASEAKTWTIVTTNSNGITCVVAAGEAWDELPPIKKGQGT